MLPFVERNPRFLQGFVNRWWSKMKLGTGKPNLAADCGGLRGGIQNVGNRSSLVLQPYCSGFACHAALVLRSSAPPHGSWHRSIISLNHSQNFTTSSAHTRASAIARFLKQRLVRRKVLRLKQMWISAASDASSSLAGCCGTTIATLPDFTLIIIRSAIHFLIEYDVAARFGCGMRSKHDFVTGSVAVFKPSFTQTIEFGRLSTFWTSAGGPARPARTSRHNYGSPPREPSLNRSCRSFGALRHHGSGKFNFRPGI